MEASQLERLRGTAQKNPTLQAILSHFYSLDKSYYSVAVRSVEQAFYKKGVYKHKRAAIVEALKALEGAGAGRYVDAPRGEGKLVDLPIPTKELGAAIVGDSKNLKRYRAEKKERGVSASAAAVRSSPSAFKIYPMRQASNVSITVTINGKPVILPLPEDLKTEELSALIERLKRVEDGYRK